LKIFCNCKLCFSYERKKSILKIPKRPATPTTSVVLSAEVLLEKAIDRTLNFLRPERRFTARQRALNDAIKWWDNDSNDSSSNNSSRKASRSVHFYVSIYQTLEDRKSMI
jgi:hypothetical protein